MEIESYPSCPVTRCASGSVIATSFEPPRLSWPPIVAMPDTVYCLAGARPDTVALSPTLKSYFVAVPRSSAISSAEAGALPSS